MEDNKLKLVLVQYDIIWGNIDLNLQHLDNIIQDEVKGSDVIILPEMFTTGFSMEILNHADTVDGKAIRWMHDLANKTNSAVVGSIIINEKSKYFNRLYWINPGGESFSYDKRHLFSMGKEDLFYEKGSQRLIVNYKGWRICPLICYDLRFPVWSRNNNAYDLLLYVANWPAARNHIWNILLRARAIENQCFVAGVNRIGRDADNLHYIGESCVVHPKGYLVTSEHEPIQQIIHSCISLNELNEFRGKFPVLNDSDDLSTLNYLKNK